DRALCGQHRGAELERPGRRRRPGLPHQGGADPVPRGNHVAAKRHRADLDSRRVRRRDPNRTRHDRQGAHPRWHPGHSVAPAVGDRDRHRLPRGQPRGLWAMDTGGSVSTPKAMLVLEDGRIFTGTTFGAVGQTLGEAVFSTGMSGYQETLTDPSYHGQIVVATAPQIGNTGWNHEDAESRGDKIWVAGYAVRDPSPRASNWRATGTLQ